MMKWVVVLLTALVAHDAQAHSPLRHSTPAHQSVVESAPETVELEFVDGIRLTRVELGQGEDMTGLDLGEGGGFVTEYSIDLGHMGSLASGLYRLEWRGLGVDGHAMQGEFEFTVE